jgi:PBSX family phage terminase large subunit
VFDFFPDVFGGFSSSELAIAVDDSLDGAVINGVSERDLVAPCYHHLLPLIIGGEKTHFVLKGGRGSGKSSFCAIRVVAHLITHPCDDAVVVVKIAHGIRDSISRNIEWAINLYGLADYFKINKTTRCFTYLPTGQVILLKGCDDPVKFKSIKSPSGRFGIIWFEELEQFTSLEEVHSVIYTFIRGIGHSSRQVVLYSFNPPQSVRHWLNSEFLLGDGQIITHTTYLDVPAEWLGETFFAIAEERKAKNEKAYRAELLGEVVGHGKEVFDNIENEVITDEFIASLPITQKGVDFGWADPTVVIECYYDKNSTTLYVFKEFYKRKVSGDSLAKWIIDNGMNRGGFIACDSADPRMITQLQVLGVKNAMGVGKGRDSIRRGLSWLSFRCAKIVVDARRCPNAYRELISYEYETTKDGVYSDTPPDKNNHAIDAIRYACYWMINGGF